MRITTTFRVSAPPATVWRIMRDVEHWHEWTASITSIDVLTPGPFAVGTRAKVKQPRFPAATWTVTTVEEGRSFEWEYRAPGNRTTGIHAVEPQPDGSSLVTLGITFGGPVGRLLGRLTRGLSERYVHMGAAGLRSRAEAEAASRSSAVGGR